MSRVGGAVADLPGAAVDEQLSLVPHHDLAGGQLGPGLGGVSAPRWECVSHGRIQPPVVVGDDVDRG